MTQLEKARKGIITKEMREVAKYEGLSTDAILDNVKQGKIVIPSNRFHRPKRVFGIGKGLKTKINTNLGTSPESNRLSLELAKAKLAIAKGTDIIMDLSTGGNLNTIRKKILETICVPLGTVPIYQTVIETVKKKKKLARMSAGDIFSTIEKQAGDGVDFMTVHAGVTLESVARLKRQKRLTAVVSRGGAFLTAWMLTNKKENPLYEHFDELLSIAQKYDITLSLGDGMRPGSLADATDRTQIQELIILGELADRARKKNVQVMIEGPGHLPLNHIEANVLLEKSLCQGAPFYVLGPLVTDIAPGYDHLTAAIGGAVAGAAGADFLCYVTPSEHLRLPTLEDVEEGVIATRIAAHVADIAKGVKGAIDKDNKMSQLRGKRKWKEQLKLAINPEKARSFRMKSKPKLSDVCTMCGEYCSLKGLEKWLS
ncbi:MAG: phosphomethylpyrimidine synthase ThiC [Candidatus Ratteibacteria bacterium]|nr:phosphomethylpyrimidine synthase ThiC [Candidatus Ratteibacteria bacterium]